MNTRLRILHLEDNPLDSELVQETLATDGNSYEVIRVETEAEFLSALQQGGIDLILADYKLPSFDGLSALKIAQRQSPHVPFIFVSGTLGEDVAIESLKIGATDYVLKTRLSRLVPSVQRALREAKEREELRRSEDALRRSEAYLATAQSLSHTGSFGWHVVSGVIFWSLETYRIYEQDLLTRPTLESIRQRVHPDDRGHLEQILDQVARICLGQLSNDRTLLGRSVQFEHRLLMDDGRVKHLRIFGRAVRDSCGEEEFVGAVTDVTEAKEAERELLEARVSERTRIARDLHDTLLQSFQALLLRFQAVINMLPERPADARKTLEEAVDHASRAIIEGRDAVAGLRTSTIDKNELAPAIRTLGEELASAETTQCSPKFEVVVGGTCRNLHPILRDEVYRLAAEALRNAFRHSGAQDVEVEIHYGDEEFRLRVRDNGKGIRPAVLRGDGREGHYGLHGMRERANVVGGKLTVSTELNRGTEIELVIPGGRAYVNKSIPGTLEGTPRQVPM